MSKLGFVTSHGDIPVEKREVFNRSSGAAAWNIFLLFRDIAETEHLRLQNRSPNPQEREKV